MRTERRPLVVINAFHTVAGGGLIYLQNLLPYLAADGRFRWRLVVTAKGLERLEIPAGVEVWQAPEFRFGLSHAFEQIILPLLAWLWGARAVWSNANYGPLLAPGAVVTIHTTPRAAAAWVGWKWRIYWGFLRALTLLCLVRAPVAFTVAEHVVPDYVPTWLPWVRQKVRVAPPAVADYVFKYINKNNELIVTVGDFYRQKNYPLLVEALAVLRAKLPGVRLRMIGRPAFPAVVAEVEALIAARGLADAVEIVPGLPHAELMRSVAESAVYVSTSAAECFNMPVLEAMSVGVPVVVGDTAFQREVAGEAGVFVPVGKGGDVASAYAVAVYGVLQNQAVADSLRRRGKLRAGQFGWDRTAAVMTTALAKVCGLR